MTITVFADTITTKSFEDWMLGYDALVEIELPRDIVLMYYIEVLHKPWKDFDNWYNNEVTAFDTDKLYDYAVKHGVDPKTIDHMDKYEVEFSHTVTVIASSPEEAVALAEKYAKQTLNYSIYVDGEYWG